jgi:predicted DNA-binding transcriptional regulator YafY
MLRAERPPDERKAVNGALDRLRKAMVTLPSDAIAAGQREVSLPALSDPATLAAVKRALSERRKLRIRYHSGSKAEASDRTVQPYALVVASGHWYLLAHCESKGEVVSFRLDRMEDVEQLDAAYDIPTTFSVDEHLNDRKVLRTGGPAKMRVRYSPRIARWIAEREGLEPDADGSLTMDHPLLDVQWGVRHVLQYGPDAEVLEPHDVRAEVARRVEAFVVNRR